jgi:hypothetical protein
LEAAVGARGGGGGVRVIVLENPANVYSSIERALPTMKKATTMKKRKSGSEEETGDSPSQLI